MRQGRGVRHPRGWSRRPARPGRAGAPPAGAPHGRAGVGRARSSSDSRPTTSPPATRGTSSERSSPSFSAGWPMPITSASATPSGGEPAQGVLATADRDLVLALLRHPDHLAAGVLARDQLVDEAAGRVAAPDDQLGADAVAVDRRGREPGDRELVEVGGDDDPGLLRAERVELGAHPVGQDAQVAGVDPHGSELGARDLDPEPHRLGDVVGVDQQGGARAEAC